MVVQHNLQAMNSNRMLNLTQSSLSKSTEKLSSGYRINRAADDAAGLAISEKMRKQINGLNQASSNAQDGISCVQTAEGALAEVEDMLQRMNQLSVQASNGTNSQDDRQNIQDEIDQLVTEIDRVAETSKFNETYLLKGATDGSTKEVNKYSPKYVDGVTDVSNLYILKDDGTLVAGDKFDADATYLKTNVATVTLATATTTANAATTYWTKDGTALKGADIAKLDAKEQQANYFSADPNNEFSDAGAQLYTATGEPVSANAYAKYFDAQGNYQGGLNTKSVDKTTGNVTYNTITQADHIVKSKDSYADDLSLTFHVGSESSYDNKIEVKIGAMDSTFLGVDILKSNENGIKDENGQLATDAIDVIANAIAKVSKQRSSLGAVQNRLEHTINNLDNIAENTTSAESAIRDTDMATEMVKYSNSNILAQAGQSMLAQANQSNQGVLSLLG